MSHVLKPKAALAEFPVRPRFPRGILVLFLTLFVGLSRTSQGAQPQLEIVEQPLLRTIPLPDGPQDISFLVSSTSGTVRNVKAMIQNITDPQGISVSLKAFETPAVTGDVTETGARVLFTANREYFATPGDYRIVFSLRGRTGSGNAQLRAQLVLKRPPAQTNSRDLSGTTLELSRRWPWSSVGSRDYRLKLAEMGGGSELSDFDVRGGAIMVEVEFPQLR